MGILETDRRESFLKRVARFILVLLAALFGQVSAIGRAVADGMFPEAAKRRYEALEATEQTEAVAALTRPVHAPERAVEPVNEKRPPSVGALIQRHARHIVHGERELEARELGDLGHKMHGWLFGLTPAECKVLIAAREGLVTMHALGRGVVPGVVSVAVGTEAAARRLAEHRKKLDLELAAIRPAYR